VWILEPLEGFVEARSMPANRRIEVRTIATFRTMNLREAVSHKHNLSLLASVCLRRAITQPRQGRHGLNIGNTRRSSDRISPFSER
jgi:hypothetical protein